MKKIFLFIPVVIGLLLSTGCVKDPLDQIDNEEDTWNYEAIRATNTDFTQYQTFYVSDSILYVDNSIAKVYKTKPNMVDQQLRSDLINLMQSRGYVPFNLADTVGGNKPDLLLNISNIDVATAYVYTGWDYYWWDYYFPYYPYYYPVSFYSYDVFMAYVVDMIDLKNTSNGSQQQSARAVWKAMLTGYDIFQTEAVNKFAQAAFDLSPYLTK